jgi:uncharacterized protein with FMN-binding domain
VKKIGHGVVALSSAAIIAVYAAGHARTRSAAEALDASGAQRRPAIPAPAASNAAAIHAPAEERAVPAAPAVESAPAVTVPAAAPHTPIPPAAKPPVSKTVPPAATPTAAKGITAPAASPVAPVAPAQKWKDGTYRAWGRSRHGDMLAFVVIEKGRIVQSGVDRCETRWPCSIVAHLYPQVLQRQSADVDYVTGATQSANAFYYGIVEALTIAEAGATDAPAVPVVPSTTLQ